MNGTEIVPYEKLEGMAAALAKSSLFNKSPEQMLALMLIAQAEGIHPASAAMEYDIIQGRPALKSQSALARFQKAGGTIRWLKSTEQEAEAAFAHPQGGSITIRWDMERARREGLSEKDNWRKRQGVMLRWRVIAEGIRVVFPACLNRMYLTDEVVDFEPMSAQDDELHNVTESEGDPEAERLRGVLSDYLALPPEQLGGNARNPIMAALNCNVRDRETLRNLVEKTEAYLNKKKEAV